MPSYMSFRHTVPQVLAETKTVTRRLGWRKLKPGQRFWAVEKAMGLKKGEKIRRLKLCECVSNRLELLRDVTDEDVVREGFPGMTREYFMALFVRINPRHRYFVPISRIEYKYVKE